jgi:hypothetical protein
MNITEAMRKIQVYISHGESRESKTLSDLSAVVQQAKREWLDAEHYYNTVTDQDLVDHAVYLMQAAEKKYMYLLKIARQEGLEYSPYTNADTNIYIRQ